MMRADDQPLLEKNFQQGLGWQEQPAEFTQTSVLGAQIPFEYKCLQALCNCQIARIFSSCLCLPYQPGHCDWPYNVKTMMDKAKDMDPKQGQARTWATKPGTWILALRAKAKD